MVAKTPRKKLGKKDVSQLLAHWRSGRSTPPVPVSSAHWRSGQSTPPWRLWPMTSGVFPAEQSLLGQWMRLVLAAGEFFCGILLSWYRNGALLAYEPTIYIPTCCLFDCASLRWQADARLMSRVCPVAFRRTADRQGIRCLLLHVDLYPNFGVGTRGALASLIQADCSQLRPSSLFL